MSPLRADRSHSSFLRFCLALCLGLAAGWSGTLFAYGPQGFDTVIVDAGHGGHDRGGGPGQQIPESTYTLDTALRLERALRTRGFRVVMTRRDDVFIPLKDRVSLAASYPNAVFVSVHYNYGQRSDAHGYETYYYRSDSFGLASRLHAAQLASLNTLDRHVRRRGFFVLRNPAIPAVLCEGGFLTNPEEAGAILSPAYRERWAQNIADALVQQRRSGDPTDLGYQPPVTTEHFGGGGGGVVAVGGGHGRSGRHGRGGRSTSRHGRGSRSGSDSRHHGHGSGNGGSSGRKTVAKSASATHKKKVKHSSSSN